MVAVFAVAGGTALVLPLLGPDTVAPGATRTVSLPAVRITPPPLAPGDTRIIACKPAHPPDDADCRRLAADLAERRPLSEADLRDSAPVMRSLILAVGGHGRGVDPRDVSRDLAWAGHPEAVVRVALPTDPVPAGSVVFAVPFHQACLMGYVPQNGMAEIRPVGQLSDGTCMYR